MRESFRNNAQQDQNKNHEDGYSKVPYQTKSFKK